MGSEQTQAAILEDIHTDARGASPRRDHGSAGVYLVCVWKGASRALRPWRAQPGSVDTSQHCTVTRTGSCYANTTVIGR